MLRFICQFQRFVVVSNDSNDSNGSVFPVNKSTLYGYIPCSFNENSICLDFGSPFLMK